MVIAKQLVALKLNNNYKIHGNPNLIKYYRRKKTNFIKLVFYNQY
jgi:hypothetical protein